MLLSTVAEGSLSYSRTVGREEDPPPGPPGLFHVSLFPLVGTPPLLPSPLWHATNSLVTLI